MFLGYIVTAYKNLFQVERLVRRLHEDNSTILILLDTKANTIEALAFESSLRDLPHVAVKRFGPIRWGQLSITLANLEGLNYFLQQTTRVPDYIFSISGQDYPLMSCQLIRALLQRAQGSSFIESSAFPVRQWIDGGRGRLFSWNIFLPGRRVLQVPKATLVQTTLVRGLHAALGKLVRQRDALPYGMNPYGGSMHWVLSRQAAEYICSFIRKHPKFLKRFRFTLISDEMFFQTILLNSPLAWKIINDDLRFLRWPTEHAPSPRLLTSVDLPSMLESGKVFARKFDATVDSTVLDALDRTAAGT